MEWISVEDEMPELGQIVWLYDGERVWIGGRDWVDYDTWLWGNSYGTIWHNGEEWDGDNEVDDDYRPTHWMPLPEPPQ